MSHNEYYAADTPMDIQLTSCTPCHAPTVVKPANNTISGFCCTCHKDFHRLEGIGGDTLSPFIRHPSDVRLPDTGEYATYDNYSVDAPVGRTTVLDSPSNSVSPGTDAVTCLSCHVAHASDYSDMLRWDYSLMVAGGIETGGCFTCHTMKNAL